MSHNKYLLCALVVLSFIFYANAAGCRINPHKANSPLLIRPGNTTVIYPVRGQRVVNFAQSETVEFACPQKKVVLNGRVATSIVQATCVSNANFRVNNLNVPWTQITCSEDPVATGRFTNSNCGTNARLAEIGFILDESRFLKLMTICFDTKNQSVLYSQYDLTASINSRISTTPRPQFYEDAGFYSTGNRNVDRLYVRGVHRSTINRLIGLPASNTKYIDNGDVNFISRGHLTARLDFVYGAQQNATFRFINAAPQWQGFNGNNWNQAEIDVRNYAHAKNANLQVWTGTYGVTTLPHETTGKDIPLYLYVNGNQRGIPVPAIYWKIVYNPVSKRGIVLVGLNNPHDGDVSKYEFCPDVSIQVNWLRWDKNNVTAGYSYACTLDSFTRVVNFAPNIRASGLLN